MKKIIASLLFATLFISTVAIAQDKSKRPSPPDSTMASLTSGAVVKISYSAPSIKGRTIGKDLEPMMGKVWRTGANEATVFETSKEVMVEGKPLPAGKYALFTIMNGDEWTVIFNKTAKQWGAFKYVEADDALRVNVKGSTAVDVAEKLKIEVGNDGRVTLLWGDKKVVFWVK